MASEEESKTVTQNNAADLAGSASSTSEAIDLGIGQLVDDSESSATADRLKEGSSVESPVLIETEKTPVVEDDRSEVLRKLSIEKNWSLLSEKADSLLSDAKYGTLAHVFWCHAELNLKRLSTAILSAPFLNTLQNAGDLEPNVKKILEEVNSGILLSLIQQREWPLCLAILESANEQKIELQRQEEIRSNLKAAINSADLASEEKETIEEVLSLVESSELIRPSKQNSLHIKDSEVVRDNSKAQTSGYTPETAVKSTDKHSKPQITTWICVILLIILGVEIYRKKPFAEPQELLIASANPPAPSINIPAMEFIPDRIERINSLDALLMDLGGNDASANPVPNPNSNVTSENLNPQTNKKVKEKVNTNTPIEPPLNVLLAGGGNTVNVAVPSNNQIANNSNINIGTERDMWILVDTDVLERPSYAAPTVGSLRRGDKIKVDAKVGDWLRLRNRDGKPGFILAQDASERGP